MYIDLSEILSIQQAWSSARNFDDEFVRIIEQNVHIGCTFVPEYLLSKGYSVKQTLDIYYYLVEVLGMRHIRLGIRLSEIDIDNQNIGIYENILRYSFDQKLSLTLCLGPIKYPRWPEYFLSHHITSSVTLPRIGSHVHHDDEVCTISRMALENLLVFITSKYSDSDLSCVIQVQCENECFNKFGSYKWTFDITHIQKCYEICERYLPNRKYLLNSAGMFDMYNIVKYLCMIENPQDYNIGLDYYYTINKMSDFSILKAVDTLAFNHHLRSISTNKLYNLQNNLGFGLEVTEAQMEPWHKSTEPGNSCRSLKYVIRRSHDFLKHENQKIIRVWGIERLVSIILYEIKTSNHDQMCTIIADINKKSSH